MIIIFSFLSHPLLKMKCHISGCMNSPTLYCTCSKSIKFSCSEHLINHLSIETLKEHNIFSTLKNVSENQKEIVKNSIIKTIKHFTLLKQKIFESYNIITDQILKCKAKLDNIIFLNKRLLKETIIKNQVTLCVSHNKKYRNSNLNCEILSLLKKENFLSLDFFSINNSIKNISESFSLTSKAFIKPDNIFLYYFIVDTNILTIFDPKKFTYFHKEIPILDPIGGRPSICLLPNNKLFCSGGRHSKSTGNTYIIDMGTFNISDKITSNERHSAKPIMINERIYLFGGWTYECLNTAEYFNVKNSKWISISNLPSYQSDTSTAKINKKIIITGLYNFLQCYNVESDTYLDLNSGIEVNSYNMLLKHNKFIYLLCGRVYYSKKAKLKYWICNPSNNISINKTCSIPVIRDNCGYFLDENLQIYKFNFEDLVLSIITRGKLLD